MNVLIWDQRKYAYQGCFSTHWDRSFTPDVSSTTDGIQQCRDGCEDAGFAYFGLECPHTNTITGEQVVHCGKLQNFIVNNLQK